MSTVYTRHSSVITFRTRLQHSFVITSSTQYNGCEQSTNIYNITVQRPPPMFLCDNIVDKVETYMATLTRDNLLVDIVQRYMLNNVRSTKVNTVHTCLCSYFEDMLTM
jgi:hypothetical protein